MKYTLLFFICFCSLLSWGQNTRVDGIALQRSGMPSPFAKVAVCSQPATISTQPCTPLVPLCASLSDAVCAVPNPVAADGLGNYFFYTKPGTYTFQFYGSGLTTTVLPDQSVGGASISGGNPPGFGTVVTANGWKCDGVTDDTAAANTLLATIGATPTRLLLPAHTGISGLCLLSNITFPANVTLDFTNGGAIKTLSSTTTPGNAVFVNSTSVECGAGVTCSTPALAVTGGNTLTADVMLYPGFTFTTTSVTDSCGNTYVQAFQSLANQPRNHGLWVASNASAGSCVVTATASGSATTQQIIVGQFSGMGPVVSADGNGASTNSTGATMSTGAATTTAGSLLVACGGPDHFHAETVTAGGGFTQMAQTANGYLQCEYRLSSAGGAVTATANLSVNPSPDTWVYSLVPLKVGSATIKILGGVIDPDLHQVFVNATGTNGVIDFTGNVGLSQVVPEWWGAAPSATAAINTPALQAAEHGAFGTGRTNGSGLSKYNRPLYLSGNYQINGELQFYDVLNFKVVCNRRLNGGITQTASNLRIIDGQSIAYGSFDDCTWANSVSSTNAQIDLDYDGVTTAGDLRPQFIDFNRNTFGGGGFTDVGVLISKSGGGAQGSNIYCTNCAASGFTGAAWQAGGDNTGRNAGRFYAQNALDLGWYGGDIQGSPLYGIAGYGAGYIFSYGTTFENGFTTQTGFDQYCEAPQGPCIMEHVRSESRRLISGGNLQVRDSRTINSALYPNPGSTFPVFPSANSIITGSVVGGDGAYYKVTVASSAFGGVGTPSATESATSGSATTIVKSGATYTVNAFTGFLASILSGTGNGEYCLITSNTSTAITCSSGWTTKYVRLPIVNPDNTSKYIVEPNWGTQTVSGGMTFAALNENGIEGIAGAPTNGTSRFEDVDVPGDQLNLSPNVTLTNVTVTRQDWLTTSGGVSALLDSPTVQSSLDVSLDESVVRSSSTYYQKWGFKRTAGVTGYSNWGQFNLPNKPFIWSAGNPNGPASALDVGIGGRSDPFSGTSFSRAVLEMIGGPIGRPTAFGTDQNGQDTDIQGGLPTGAGTPANINFWTGNAGGSSANVADGTKRWQITGLGHLFAFADNTYDIGAAGANRPRTGYFGTSIVTPNLNGTLYASTQSGSDPFAKIQTALNSISGSGCGTVIADFTGSQSTSTPLVLKSGCTVQFGPATYTVSTPQYTIAAAATGAVENAGQTQATITTTAPNNYLQNQMVTISGVTNTAFNGVFPILSITNSSTFVVANTLPAANATSGSGKAQQPAITVDKGATLMGGTSLTTNNFTTEFIAAAGFAADVVDAVADDLGTSPSDSWHSGTLSNFYVNGGGLGGNTVGNGVGIYLPGEAGIVEKVIVDRPGQNGFHIVGDTAGTGVFMANSAFNAPNCGFFLDQVFASFHMVGVGGDDNISGICVTPGAGVGNFVLSIDKLKLESNVNTHSNPAILIDGTNAPTFLSINDLLAGQVAGGADVIKFIGGQDNYPSIEITNAYISSNFTNLYNNTKASVLYPLTSFINNAGNVQHWTWSPLSVPLFENIGLYQETQAVVNGLNSDVCMGGRASPGGFLRLTGPSGAFSIGGFNTSCSVGFATIPGRMLTIENSTTQTMTIVDEDAGSTAGFRIRTGTAANVVCPAHAFTTATFIYSGADSRWIQTGGSCK